MNLRGYLTAFAVAGLLGNSNAAEQPAETSKPLDQEISIGLSNARQDINELRTGRPKFTGRPQFKLGVQYNDSTTQTTAYIVPASTAGFYNVNGTATVYDTCVATYTLTTRAMPVRIATSGCSMTHSGSNGYPVLDVLVDGARPSPYSGTLHLAMNGNVASVYIPMTINYVTAALSAGSHSFCLAPGEDGSGTATFNWANAQIGGCYFSVSEEPR